MLFDKVAHLNQQVPQAACDYCTELDTCLRVWLEGPKPAPNMRPILKLYLFVIKDLILSLQDCIFGWDYTMC